MCGCAAAPLTPPPVPSPYCPYQHPSNVESSKQIIKAQERALAESAPKPLNAAQQAEVDGLRQQAKGGWPVWTACVELGMGGPYVCWLRGCLAGVHTWLRSWPHRLPTGRLSAVSFHAADLTERSEKLAEEGDVDASMAAVAQAERLRK